jgi:hypothetical protein
LLPLNFVFRMMYRHVLQAGMAGWEEVSMLPVTEACTWPPKAELFINCPKPSYWTYFSHCAILPSPVFPPPLKPKNPPVWKKNEVVLDGFMASRRANGLSTKLMLWACYYKIFFLSLWNWWKSVCRVVIRRLLFSGIKIGAKKDDGKVLERKSPDIMGRKIWWVRHLVKTRHAPGERQKPNGANHKPPPPKKPPTTKDGKKWYIV